MVTHFLDIKGFEGDYEVSEAANYLRATMPLIPGNPQKIYSRKLIRWIRSGLFDPDLVGIPGHALLITFEDLISMRVISFMRYFGYSFHKIHQAHTRLCSLTGHDKPFATERLWIERLGAIEIYAEIEDNLLAIANRGGQLAFWELVRDNLVRVHNMTFVDGVATSWTAHEGVRLDPRIQFGRPCIDGTRVPTTDIVGMYEAGDGIDFLASSYGLSKDQVESAIEWEGQIATKKVGK